jgi:lysozyme
VKISETGVNLIKSFEGLRLESYLCPVGVWTIGYGHTGDDVSPEMKITEDRANKMLRRDLVKFEQGVDLLITVPLNQQQFDALVSFAFNCGLGSLEESTLRKRLNNKEDPNKVAQEELPKWVKGDGVVLPGLVERRKKEVELFTSGDELKPIETIDIRCVTNTFLKKEPVPSSELKLNQRVPIKKDREYKGVQVLEKRAKHTKLLLPWGLGVWWAFDEHWYGLAGAMAKPVEKAEVLYDGLILPVPYQSQRDNYRDANRTCFSSSCAMAAMYLRPGSVANDNEYIKKVFAIGDTTEAWVQVKALQGLGFKASFKQNGNIEDLKQRIDQGFPCPVGILHHGPANAPSGSGHWICVIGYEEEKQRFIVHDPWGEIDNYSGTYISTNGERLRYSYNLFKRRWTVDGPNTGWWIDLK